MGGPFSSNVGLPVLTNPWIFARGVVSGAYDVRGMVLHEAVLESAGLKTLARLLEAVREGRYVRAQDLARAERVIARLADRDWGRIKTALAAAQWTDSSLRQDPFGELDPIALKAILLPLPVATGREVQLSAGGASSSTASRGRRPKMEARAGVTSGEVRGIAPAGSTVGYIGRVDDEERLVGPGRQGILSDFLGQQGVPGNTSLEIALKILEDPQQSLALKVIAIRVLGDNIGELNRLETFLRTLEIIVAQFQAGVDSRLKEMALAFLKQLDSSFRPGVLAFFDQAIIQIGGGARSLTTPKLYLPGGEQLDAEEFRRHQERIVGLYASLRVNYSAELPTPSNFESGERLARPLAWHSAYPPWYTVLPKVLGISGRGEELTRQARTIFTNSSSSGYWERALALIYYSFLLHPSQRLFLSRDEADQATRDLLQLIEKDVFPEMALAVYRNVIYNQVNAPLAQEDPHRDLWVSFKITELAVVVGGQHPEVIRLQNLVRHLARRKEAIRVQSNPPRPQSPWQRALTALRRFFN